MTRRYGKPDPPPPIEPGHDAHGNLLKPWVPCAKGGAGMCAVLESDTGQFVWCAYQPLDERTGEICKYLSRGRP